MTDASIKASSPDANPKCGSLRYEKITALNYGAAKTHIGVCRLQGQEMPDGHDPSEANRPEATNPRAPEQFCDVVKPTPRRTTKESKVRAVTITVIALAAILVIARQAEWRLPSAASVVSPTPPREERPQDAIYRMLDAAGRGDTEAYIACYSGSMRRRLEQSRDEMTDGGFARYLVENNKQIKGIAIADPETLSENEVQVRVEFVYQDRNEAQQFFLERSAGEWSIARVSAAERVETLVPYGTPVN